MAVRAGYAYIAKFVKHKTVNGQPVTSFSIGDKVRGATGTQYQNYDFTVWGEHVNIKDNDKAKIEDIESIECRAYNGKTYFGISGRISVEVKEEIEYAEETPTFAPDKSSARVAVEEKPEYIELDADTALPFDM